MDLDSVVALRQDFKALETRLFDQISRNQTLQNASLEASLKSIDTLRRAGMAAALLLAVFGTFLAFFGVRTLNDVRIYARSEVLKAVTGQADDSGEIVKQIDSLRDRFEEAVARADNALDEINSRRNEYAFLREIDINTPTLNYLVFSSELDEIYQSFEEIVNDWRNDPDSMPTPSIQRFLDDEMRNKAATVFSTLISAIEEGEGISGRISRDTLFNAAADAFRIEFNALGLRLVAAARQIGAPNEPIPAEHEARFLRAQLQLQQISVEDSLQRVSDILENSNSVNAPFVLSEMWNLGSISGAPERVARHLIEDLKRWDGFPPSYSLVTIGRLLGRSHHPTEWALGRCFVKLAFQRWKNEPRSVSWEAQSWEQIRLAAYELEIDLNQEEISAEELQPCRQHVDLDFAD